MFRRRLSVALAVGAALLTVTACSSSPSTGGSTSTGSGPAADSMPAPDKILTTIKSAATSAKAVAIKGSITDSGTAESLDVKLNKGGDSSGNIGEGGTTVPVIVSKKVYYVQFTKELMSGNGVDPNSDAGKLLLNKWVPSTATMLANTGMVDGLKQALDFNTLVPGMFDQFPKETPKDSGTDTVDGTPVHVYTFSDGSKADVATAAPHYLMKLTEPASEGKGELDFSSWDQAIKIDAPPAADIYSGPGA